MSYQLLEKPYQTNCIDYPSKTEYLSREDCIRRNRLNKSITECKVIAEGINLFKWETGIFMNSTLDEKCIENINIEIDKYSSQKCQQLDCVKNYYKPVLISREIYDKKDIRIDITCPSDPETTYGHKPRIETIEFLCYIASILSLWFDFSFFSLYFLIKNSLKWFDSRSKIKRKFDQNLKQFLHINTRQQYSVYY
jgi:hypothetical protein